jgi:hypothetical protein
VPATRLLIALSSVSWMHGLATPQSIGVVTDPTASRAFLFDADSYQTLGSISLPPNASTCYGDIAINADGTLAYLSGFNNQIHVLDITTRPPTLASGINPITTSHVIGGRIDITPDGRFLLTSGDTVMSIDLDTRTEVSAFSTGSVQTGLCAAFPGDVLITSSASLQLRRLTIAPDGTLADPLEQTNVLSSADIVRSPGTVFGVCSSSGGTNQNFVRSFRVAPLATVDTCPAFGGAVTLNPDSNRVYIRGSSLEAVTFDAATGALGAEPLFRIELPNNGCFLARPAFHPDGTRIFLTVPEQVLVIDPNDGHTLGRVTDALLVNPQAIRIHAGPEAF